MKVVAINGSPKKEGNTYHALRMVGAQLEENDQRYPARTGCGEESVDKFYQVSFCGNTKLRAIFPKNNYLLQ